VLFRSQALHGPLINLYMLFDSSGIVSSDDVTPLCSVRSTFWRSMDQEDDDDDAAKTTTDAAKSANTTPAATPTKTPGEFPPKQYQSGRLGCRTIEQLTISDHIVHVCSRGCQSCCVFRTSRICQ